MGDPGNASVARRVPAFVTTTGPATRAPERTVPPHAGAWLALVLFSAVFVLVAVFLEVLGGSYANSPLPPWAQVVPLSWPQGVRVLWWLGVAAAAAGFRLGLHRLGIRQRPLIVIASIAPFLAFAAGIASGASWSTWH